MVQHKSCSHGNGVIPCILSPGLLKGLGLTLIIMLPDLPEKLAGCRLEQGRSFQGVDMCMTTGFLVVSAQAGGYSYLTYHVKAGRISAVGARAAPAATTAVKQIRFLPDPTCFVGGTHPQPPAFAASVRKHCLGLTHGAPRMSAKLGAVALIRSADE